MRTPVNLSVPGYFDINNIKLRIDSLLFEILLDRSFISKLIQHVPKHNHFVFEIQFFETGSGVIYIGENEIPITPGSVHFIGPGIYHAMKPSKDDPLSRFYIQFTFKDTFHHDDYFPELETREIKEILLNADYFQFSDTAVMKSFTERIKAELASPSLGYYTNIQSMFMQMIVHIVRSLRPEKASYPLLPKGLDDLRSRVIEYFFTRYKEHLMLEELAGLLNLSTKQTNRIIQGYYGVSFKQKLLETRMEVAKDLLLTSHLSLRQIAEEVGYTQPRNFSELFLKRTGLTPSQYQKKHR